MSGRGLNLELQRAQVVMRALGAVYCRPVRPDRAPDDWVPCLIQYRLEGGYNGDKDPAAPHCASWSFGLRVPTADCVGFALWAAGIDRYQPGYAGSRGEWLNCDSIIDDAHGARKFFFPVSSLGGQPGDLLVSPSGAGEHGHIGVLLSSGNGSRQETMAVDCSPFHAVYKDVTTAREKGAIGFRPQWSKDCQVIRPNWYAV